MTTEVKPYKTNIQKNIYIYRRRMWESSEIVVDLVYRVSLIILLITLFTLLMLHYFFNP